MDVKLFSLCKQEVPKSEQGKECILKCMKSFFPECEDFMPFTSQKRMLLAVSQSLRAADIVVVAVQNSVYNATKRLLCSALGIRQVPNADVAGKLDKFLDAGLIKQAMYDANVSMPEGAELFLTDTGVNCGFALAAGGQHILYIPIDAPLTHEVVLGSVYDYIALNCEPEHIRPAMEFRHREIIRRTSEKLIEDNVKVAIHSEVLEDYIPSRLGGHKLNSGFVFDNNMDIQPSKDFYICSARDLRDRHFAQYGVVFSKPYSDERGNYIIVTIADESGTDTITIPGEDGESAAELFSSAVDRVMLMLYDYRSISGDTSEQLSTEDKKIQRTIACITAGVTAASAIVGLIIAFILK